MLEAPRGIQERELLYGPAKVGKSACWADIIRALGIEGNFDAGTRAFLIDMDRTWGKMLHWIEEAGISWDYRTDREVKDGRPLPKSSVVVYEPKDIYQFARAAREIGKEATRGDWGFADMMDWPWEKAQDAYIEGVYEESPEEYFIKMRSEVKKAREVKGGKKSSKEFGGHDGKDWAWIGKQYRAGWSHFKGGIFHYVAIAPESTLSDQWATAEQIAQYKPVGGAKPDGNKRLANDCDTLLRVTKRASGLREFTMVGDRGREHIWERRQEEGLGRTIKLGDVLEDEGFAQKYLVEVVGWTKTARQRDAGRQMSGAREGSTTRSRRGTTNSSEPRSGRDSGRRATRLPASQPTSTPTSPTSTRGSRRSSG